MQTALKLEQGQLVVITQQYEVGLYITIYSADESFKTIGIPLQRTSQEDEKKYHQQLRLKAIKNGEFVEEHSTVID